MLTVGRFFKIFSIAILCALAFSSCHSSKDAARWEDPIYARKNGSKKGGGNDRNSAVDVKVGGSAQKVIDAACSWIGVPYRYGGNTKSGVDCSGLVCMAFDTGAGVKLPRSSREQAKFCKKINKNSARPGDLFFFASRKGGNTINHVALYLGNDRIVHSTTSKGVIISSLSEDYWVAHFHSCGRVFE